MPLITLGNGKKVHIRDVSAEKESDKLPIVFIHGLGSSQNFYGSLIPELSKERRCVCLDTPGSARSPTPKGDQSIQSISDDIISLLDELKLDKVVLVGHSMGGIVVCNVAAEYADRVEKLILVGPVHPTEKGHKTFADRIKLVKKGIQQSID
jgi:pimeloyl-ACP methyl ester carboxylesterase